VANRLRVEKISGPLDGNSEKKWLACRGSQEGEKKRIWFEAEKGKNGVFL